MEIKTIVIISIIALIFIYIFIWGGMAPKPYRSRNCMGKKWKNEFPDLPVEEVRNFLLLFTEAFAFKPKEKLKFEPQDKIIDIYNALYPLKGADALELETLADDIEEKYSVSFGQVWNEELTLGELFNYVISAQGAPLDRQKRRTYRRNACGAK
jgi:propanediol dehydratase small subunit